MPITQVNLSYQHDNMQARVEEVGIHRVVHRCSSNTQRRSPQMIPSRTVFNHRKWIYIELAITRARSCHGPLVYQPPSSAYEPSQSSNVFPISSLDAMPAILPPCLPNRDPSVGSVIRRCVFDLSFPFVYYPSYPRRIYFPFFSSFYSLRSQETCSLMSVCLSFLFLESEMKQQVASK